VQCAELPPSYRSDAWGDSPARPVTMKLLMSREKYRLQYGGVRRSSASAIEILSWSYSLILGSCGLLELSAAASCEGWVELRRLAGFQQDRQVAMSESSEPAQESGRLRRGFAVISGER